MTFAHDIPSALSENECEHLSQLASGKSRVLEMGAYLGRSTIALSTSARVDSIDWHQGDPQTGKGDLATFMRGLERYKVTDRVRVHIMRFEEIVGCLTAGYDLVFVDGAHDKTSVSRDAQIARSVVRKGGLLVFHDWGRFEVTPALRQTLGEPTRLFETLAIYEVARG